MAWQEHIKVHPSAEMFPQMSGAELEELGRDIVANGLRHPIVLFCDREKRGPRDRAEPSELVVLDGRNRLNALEAVGIRIVDDGGYLWPDVAVEGEPVEIIWRSLGGSEEFDPYAYVISANVRRRHLNT